MHFIFTCILIPTRFIFGFMVIQIPFCITVFISGIIFFLLEELPVVFFFGIGAAGGKVLQVLLT
jgi:hypothetical protein